VRLCQSVNMKTQTLSDLPTNNEQGFVLRIKNLRFLNDFGAVSPKLFLIFSSTSGS
jgi:hypothetical protein